jgi:hypothetical protein
MATIHVERQQRPALLLSSVMRGELMKEEIIVSARTFFVSSQPLPQSLEVPPSTESKLKSEV